MARVIWSREALVHLDLVAEYIEQFDPEAGRRLARRVFEAGQSLRDFPLRGHPAAGEIRTLSAVWPYLIHYVVVEETVMILDVRHGRRKTR